MNSFGEIVLTKFSIQIFQRAITPVKIIETEQDYDVQNLECYISILQSFIKIQQTVFKKEMFGQNFQYKYFKGP